MNMNDIREKYSEIIDKFTNEFAKKFGDDGTLISELEFRDKLREVRDKNYDPMFMELVFAMHLVFEDKYRLALSKHEDAANLTDIEIECYKHESEIADKIINYLERQPTENAKKGKDAQDAKLDPVRRFAVDLAARGSYPSYRNAALSIKREVLEFAKANGTPRSEFQAEKTIIGWLKEGGYIPTPRPEKEGDPYEGANG